MSAVAQKLRAAGEKFGLVAFGAKGDPFDPELHDALVQNPNPEVSVAEVADVIEPGLQDSRSTIATRQGRCVSTSRIMR